MWVGEIGGGEERAGRGEGGDGEDKGKGGEVGYVVGFEAKGGEFGFGAVGEEVGVGG